jgi:hypothetical protein
MSEMVNEMIVDGEVFCWQNGGEVDVSTVTLGRWKAVVTVDTETFSIYRGYTMPADRSDPNCRFRVSWGSSLEDVQRECVRSLQDLPQDDERMFERSYLFDHRLVVRGHADRPFSVEISEGECIGFNCPDLGIDWVDMRGLPGDREAFALFEEVVGEIDAALPFMVQRAIAKLKDRGVL